MTAARTRLKHPWHLVGFILLGLVFLWVAVTAFHALRLAAAAHTAKNELLPLLEEKGALDPKVVDLAVPQLHQAAGDLQALERLTSPLMPSAPFFGPAARQAPALLEYAASVSEAADRLAIVFSPVLDALADDGQGSSEGLIQAALTAITEGKEGIQAAQAALDQAARARQEIDAGMLPGEAQSLITKVDERFPQLVAGISFLEVIPELLGATSQRTYLLLIQNRDELRASGGFISGLGTIRLNSGRVTEMKIGDSYAVDDFSKNYPTPPDPLSRFMLAGLWLPRDANWSPDFPTTARQVANLYTLSTGREVDGVIALDLAALKGVLEATGEITAPGFPAPVSSAKIESLVQAAWSAEPGQALDAVWWEGRKDFMGTLGKALLQKLLENPNQKLIIGVADKLEDALDEGHLLLYFDNLEAEQALAQAGWEGSLPVKVDGDFLNLVDSNLGFNKMDARVSRKLSYRVDLSNPEKPLAQVQVIYTNLAAQNVSCKHVADYGSGIYSDMQERCYWDYYRIYLPAGTVLESGRGPALQPGWLLGGESQAVLAGDVEILPVEAGLQPFGGMLVVPTATEAELNLSVSLPQSTIVKTPDGYMVYSLTIRKQPGLDQLPLALEIIPPAGYQAVLPAEWTRQANGHLSWSGEIKQMTHFEILFVKQ